MRWLLLALTIATIWMTVEAFLWRAGAKNIPFQEIARLWKGGLSHLSLGERRNLHERYGSMSGGMGELVWILAVLCVALMVATVREFLQ